MASGEQTTLTELKEMIGKLVKVQGGMASKLESVSSDMKHLSYRLSMVEKSVESLSSQMSDRPLDVASSIALENVQQGICAAVSFNTPLNVMFYGVGYKPQQHGLPLESMFRQFMFEELHAEESRAFTMPIHVQYLPRMSRTDRHNPICVTFRSSKDKDYIKHKVDKYQDSLHDLGIWAKGTYYADGTLCLWKT